MTDEERMTSIAMKHYPYFGTCATCLTPYPCDTAWLLALVPGGPELKPLGASDDPRA